MSLVEETLWDGLLQDAFGRLGPCAKHIRSLPSHKATTTAGANDNGNGRDECCNFFSSIFDNFIEMFSRLTKVASVAVVGAMVGVARSVTVRGGQKIAKRKLPAPLVVIDPRARIL